MKKLITAFVFGAIILSSVAPAAFAASISTSAIATSASVNGALSMTVELRKNDFSGAVITSMDFGQLADIGTGNLRSSPTGTTATGAVRALITANSHGLPYTITQTGTAMSNGTTTLPSGACVVKPIYVAADNASAAQPVGSTVGTAGTWVATNKVLYQSETGTAAMRAIDAFYSITDDTAAGASLPVVSLGQAGGTYTGTVTITVTA